MGSLPPFCYRQRRIHRKKSERDSRFRRPLPRSYHPSRPYRVTLPSSRSLFWRGRTHPPNAAPPPGIWTAASLASWRRRRSLSFGERRWDRTALVCLVCRCVRWSERACCGDAMTRRRTSPTAVLLDYKRTSHDSGMPVRSSTRARKARKSNGRTSRAASAQQLALLDDALDDFSHLENDDFLTGLGGGHATVPGSMVEFEDIWPGLSKKVSSSCPPDLALVKQEDLTVPDSDIRALVKDRQKKDNHNMIERRRRFNINDRIKELGTLLPRNNDRHYELVRDIRQNKGTILKATVDYVKTLKKENDRIPAMEERNHQLVQQNKQLLLRVQELEHLLQSNGIALSSQTWQPTTENQLSDLLGQESTHSTSCDPLDLLDFESIKNEASSPAPSLSSGLSSAPSASPGHALAHYDDIMDDDPVTCSGDPLLSSHVLQDSLCSPIHMDYHT